MIRTIVSRRPPRGISLVELLMAMGGICVVITTTAMLLHGVMRAQSESRHFFDDERTSARLARRFRADVHAAERIADGSAGVITTLELPGGESIEYRLADDSRGIQRRLLASGDPLPTARDDYPFAGPCAAVVSVAGPLLVLEIGAEGGDGTLAAPGTVAPPRTPTEARRKPPALVVEAILGRDLRFRSTDAGKESP